jgi:hypothetical protein
VLDQPSPRGRSDPARRMGRLFFRRQITQRLLPALRAATPDLILLSMGFDVGCPPPPRAARRLRPRTPPRAVTPRTPPQTVSFLWGYSLERYASGVLDA